MIVYRQILLCLLDQQKICKLSQFSFKCIKNTCVISRSRVTLMLLQSYDALFSKYNKYYSLGPTINETYIYQCISTLKLTSQYSYFPDYEIEKLSCIWIDSVSACSPNCKGVDQSGLWRRWFCSNDLKWIGHLNCIIHHWMYVYDYNEIIFSSLVGRFV